MLSQFIYNSKNNALYLQCELPIYINRRYMEYFCFAFMNSIKNCNVKSIHINPSNIRMSIQSEVNKKEFESIQLSGVDKKMSSNVAYKLELNKTIVTACIITKDSSIYDDFYKRVIEILNSALTLYMNENNVEKAKKKNDTMLISEQELAKYYNQDLFLKYCENISHSNLSSLLILNDKNKLAIYFRTQNGLYAVPVDIWKNGEREKRSQGYYYTENAKKIMKMRSNNNEVSNVGQDLQFVDVHPIYPNINKQKYIIAYNSIANLRKDYDANSADVCYCTLADIKGDMNTFDKSKFRDESQSFIYRDGIHSLILPKSDSLIKDFHLI